MKRRASHLAMIAVAVLLLCRMAVAGELLVCEFAGPAPAANTPWTATSSLAPDLVFSGWRLGAGAHGDRERRDAFGFHVNAPGERQSTLAEAIAENEYVAFTIEAADDGALDLAGCEVEFGIQRATWHAARRYALLSSRTGFDAGGAVFVTRSLDSGDFAERHFRFFLPPEHFAAAPGPIEFRLYAFEANYNHKTALTHFRLSRFAGAVRRLTLDAEQGGRAVAEPAVEWHRDGDAVKLFAEPEAGFRFAGWTGDVTGFGNPVGIAMDADRRVTAAFAPNPAPAMQMGTNLGAVVDWATDWVFVDVFKRSRDWRTRHAEGAGPHTWDTNLNRRIPLDANGWPTHVPFDPGEGSPPQIVHTIIINLPVTGRYTLIVEGTGMMRVAGDGTPRTEFEFTGGEARHSVDVARADATLHLEIHRSDSGDHLRNIRLVMPGFLETHEADPFHPLYLERLRPFTNLRFMDWAETNSSPLRTWDERTTPASNTQARANGVALEYMAMLANRLGADLWICIPHAADDNYIREAARLLRREVDPKLRLYIEYSNETWNTAGPFRQTAYVQDQGEALGLARDRWTAGQRFVVRRSLDIWRLFEEEFGGRERLTFVMATQAANMSLTRLRAEALNDPAINPQRLMPDVLAIAPYFGKTYSPADVAEQGHPTIDEIVDVVSPRLIAWARGAVREQKALANAQGWSLVCYEGGQHFVGIAGGENDERLNDILIGANRDARMHTRYIEYLDMLQEEGVELFSNFSFVGAPSKWGSWGVLERQDQPVEQAPKYRALLDWIAANIRQPDPGM